MANISPGPVAGIDCKAYYNSATHATPTWVLIPRMQDVSVTDYGVNQVAANSRESLYEAFVNGLIKIGVTFNYLHYRGTDTVRTALAAMVSGRTSKEFAFMDGAIADTGASGVRCFMNLEKFARSEGLESALVYEGSLKPAYAVESSAKVDPDLYVIP